MRAICVDDELLTVEYTVQQCRQLPGLDEVVGFTRPAEALAWLDAHPVDIALLDIDMPQINGIMLAEKLKRVQPDAAIIFLTAYPQYAVDAFQLRASGYLLKPVPLQRLAEEVEYALSRRPAPPAVHIAVRTFGNFDILVDGRPLSFRRARAKELLAYLVDRQGAGVSRQEAFAALWGDALYDHSMQKQLDVMIRSLRDTLRENGVAEIFELKNRSMRVIPERFECDLYRFLKGDPEAVNAYRGEYMAGYSWATIGEARISRMTGDH